MHLVNANVKGEVANIDAKGQRCAECHGGHFAGTHRQEGSERKCRIYG